MTNEAKGRGKETEKRKKRKEREDYECLIKFDLDCIQHGIDTPFLPI